MLGSMSFCFDLFRMVIRGFSRLFWVKVLRMLCCCGCVLFRQWIVGVLCSMAEFGRVLGGFVFRVVSVGCCVPCRRIVCCGL